MAGDREMAADGSAVDGFDNGVVPRMHRRWPRVRLDAGFSMVCSELPEVVSTRGGGVSLVGCGVRTSASSCSSFCDSKKSKKVIRLCARERGGKDSAAGAHRVGRDSRK